MKFSALCALVASASAVQMGKTNLAQTGTLEETQARLDQLQTNLAELQDQQQNPHLLATKYMKQAKDIMMSVAQKGRAAEKKSNEEHITEPNTRIGKLNDEKKHIEEAETQAAQMWFYKP